MTSVATAGASSASRGKRLLLWIAAVLLALGAYLCFVTRPVKMSALHEASMNGDVKYCGQAIEIEGSVTELHTFGSGIVNYYVRDSPFEFVGVRYDPNKNKAPDVGDKLAVTGILSCGFGQPVQPGTKYFQYELAEISRVRRQTN